MRALFTPIQAPSPFIAKSPISGDFFFPLFCPKSPLFLHNSTNPFYKLRQIAVKPTKMTTSSMASTTADNSQTTEPFSVLFVCLGNICRSPAAEGVFRHLVKERGLDSKFYIDSAGTINYHEVYMLIKSQSPVFLVIIYGSSKRIPRSLAYFECCKFLHKENHKYYGDLRSLSLCFVENDPQKSFTLVGV